MSEDFEVDVESEVVETKRVNLGLDVIGIYQRAFVEEAKELIPIAAAAALWIVTLWVPFINIGTTVAMFTLPVWIVAGRKISPIDIFQKDHRLRMFDLLRLHGVVIASSFILLVLMSFAYTRMVLMNRSGGVSAAARFYGISVGFWSWVKMLIVFACAAVPFFMLTTAWAMAPFLIIDKNLDPSEALRKSYELTADRRLGVFAVYAPPLALGLALAWLLGRIPYAGGWLVALVVVATATATIALSAKVYAALRDQ